ncbi:MAG: hypothetical protein ATN33_01055 [Epulopiscium sp. Nele67-Bin001]|nr:MAG: hypothetical protein ATN33_01055 [Epulopiscium sp. Nele67-Bin001]
MMDLVLTIIIIMGIMLFVKFKFGKDNKGKYTAKQIYLTLAVIGFCYTCIGGFVANLFLG